MKTRWPSALAFSVFMLVQGSCGKGEVSAPLPPATPPASVLESIASADLLEDITRLASDEFEGRAPASRGEELTVDYLEGRFREMGLQGGAEGGGFRQKVPLVGITTNPNVRLSVTSPRTSVILEYGTDFMAWTKRVADEAEMDAELVFVGYGTVAPEYGWDDYKGVDVKGKVLVMLVNDPPLEDENMFGGKAMTYYGRWTYKFEIAAEKQAAGCLVIHETGPAGYPWEVVSGGWSGEQFDLMTPDRNAGRAGVEGWLSLRAAQALARMAGKRFHRLKEQAASPDFQPVPLGLKASIKLRNKVRTLDSSNVIAKIEGSDPELRDQYVAYVAHWDHLGVGNPLGGDSIYNGAIDNASGTAALLELGETFAALEIPPRRSLLFMAVTAEESGLLGSKYYARNPVYPLVKTAAVVNMDSMNVWGETKDITVIGLGNSTLDETVRTIARRQGRSVRPDPEPENGYFYRSDHFEFAKEGVPALYAVSGVDYVGKPEGWGLEVREKYTARDYHKPSDEVKSDWDLSGMVTDVRLLFQVGYQVANQEELPRWMPGTEFKAKREEMLRAAGMVP